MKEELLNQICGELSTKNFSIEHPEVAKEWLVKALNELRLLEYLGINWLIDDLEKIIKEIRTRCQANNMPSTAVDKGNENDI